MTFPISYSPSARLVPPQAYATKNLVVAELSKPDMRAQATSCDTLNKAATKKTVPPERQLSILDHLLSMVGFAVFILGGIGSMALGGPIGAAIYFGVTVGALAAWGKAEHNRYLADHAQFLAQDNSAQPE
jgi:hypothetical protein